jgi:hypothetical protein
LTPQIRNGFGTPSRSRFTAVTVVSTLAVSGRGAGMIENPCFE